MLTIYIPTYNRLKYLKLLLTALFVELDENPTITSYVIIKIFNNNSSDGTGDFLNSLARENLFVCNRINNIGGDANISDAINHCDAKYLWILGDDDIPYKGLLTKIVHSLCYQKPDLLYLPAAWCSDVFEKPIPIVASSSSVEVKNPEQFIKIVGIKLTFISSFIFSLCYYSSHKSNEDARVTSNTNFAHLAFFSPAILSGGALFVMNDVVIRATGNSNHKYSLMHSFGVDLPKVVRNIFAINENLVDLMIKNLLIAFLPSFLYSIKFGSSKSLDKDIPWENLRSVLGDYKAFWIFVYPLKFLPKFLALPLVVLGRFFR